MSFVRNLFADLVAKRLWPVALILVGTLIAVPVILGRGTGPDPLPTAGGGASTGSSPIVSAAAEGQEEGHKQTGRNPFDHPRVQPEGAGVTGNGTGDGPSGDSTGSFDGVGGGVDATGGLPALQDVDVVPVGGGDNAPAPRPKATESYRVDMRFGQDGSLTARNDVARLSPLPNAQDPFFVFMGVLADGETALFLVSSDADATGDGTCKPTPENCERVEMQAGETEFFDVTKPDGSTVQYQLDLVRVARVSSASSAVAAAQRARESRNGRYILREAVQTQQVDVEDLAYSRELGVIVPSGASRSESPVSLFGGFRTDLRFGAPGAVINRFNIARLTPLPSADDPNLLFLGVFGEKGYERAMFLNPAEAATSGDAVCNPSPEDCTRFELKPGQTSLLDVPALDGTTSEYQLDVVDITPVEASSPEEAEALRERESPAGRVILRRLITEVGGLVADLNYSTSQGKIVRREKTVDDAATDYYVPGK